MIHNFYYFASPNHWPSVIAVSYNIIDAFWNWVCNSLSGIRMFDMLGRGLVVL